MDDPLPKDVRGIPPGVGVQADLGISVRKHERHAHLPDTVDAIGNRILVGGFLARHARRVSPSCSTHPVRSSLALPLGFSWFLLVALAPQPHRVVQAALRPVTAVRHRIARGPRAAARRGVSLRAVLQSPAKAVARVAAPVVGKAAPRARRARPAARDPRYPKTRS
jgi:hypothetical protein